jgi:basic membrane protein A
MKKKLLIVLLFVVLIAVPVFAGGQKEATTENVGTSSEATKTVAIVLGVGGLGDESFNDNCYNSLVEAQKKYGIEFDYVEPQSVSEFESFHREFSQSHEYDLIMASGYDQADAISKVATEFPDQKFLLIDSSVDNSNVVSIIYKDNESTFLAGALAALDTNTGKVGMLGALDIDVINTFIAGFKAGATEINPSIDVDIRYCGSFNDPVTAKEMSLSMYKSGVDIIHNAAGGSGLGIFQASADFGDGAYAMGVDANQNGVKPDHIILSSVRNTPAVILAQIKALVNDEFVGGVHYVGLADDAVDITYDGSNVVVPQEYKDQVEELKAKIISGEIKVPSKLN